MSKSNSSISGDREVTIALTNGGCIISPSVQSLIAMFPQSYGLNPSANFSDPNRLLPYGEIFDFGLILLPGLYTFARDHLESMGYKVTIREDRKWTTQHQPHAGLLAMEASRDADWYKAFADADRGLLVIKNSAQRPNYLKRFCELFHKATVAVVVNDVGAAKVLHQALSAASREPINLFAGDHRKKSAGARIVVLTVAELKCFDTHEIHVVLVPDVARMLGVDPMMALAWLGRRQPWRVYGMLLENDPMTPGELLQAQGLCGPLLYSAGCRVVPPIVMTYDAPVMVATRHEGPLEHKRKTIYQHGPRNQAIAKITRACAMQDLATLNGCGLFLLERDRIELTWADRPAVSILVESVEHARALRRELPDWPIYSTADLLDTCDAQGDGVIATCRIETLQHAARHKLDVDVLIRVDGAVTSSKVYGIPRCNPNRPKPLFVVEMNDGPNRKNKRALEQRLLNYQSIGGILRSNHAQ